MDRFEGIEDQQGYNEWLKQIPFFKNSSRRLKDHKVAVPELLSPKDKKLSTQAGFGKLLDHIARQENPISKRLITICPDVSGTTSLGSWINRKKLLLAIQKRRVQGQRNSINCKVGKLNRQDSI